MYSVHGEYRFSCLPMPVPADAKESGGRLGGDDLRQYLESMADRFLKNNIRYNTIVTDIHRASADQSESQEGKRWLWGSGKEFTSALLQHAADKQSSRMGAIPCF